MLEATADTPIDRAAPRLGGRLTTLLVAAALMAAFCGVLALIQYSTPNMPDNDGYYHIKMGALIREQGLRPAFPWLPLTILGPQAFYDHHMLYHAYLALFAGDGQPADMLAGAKLAAVIMPALAFLAIWWLLRGQAVPYAALWALGLCAISEAFLYRMSITRAQSASLLVLALALHWLLRRRYALLLPLGFLYVWLYNAFPLLLALVAAEALATLMSERRVEWRGAAFALAGVALGLVINPYFPANLGFIISHLLPKIGQPDVAVGNEWYPYQTWTLVENSGAALAALVAGALALGWRGQRMGRATLASFMLAVFFALLVLKARRFVEYFPPFALIFAALASGPLLRDLLAPRDGWWGARALAWCLRAGLPIALAAMVALSTLAAREAMSSSKPAETFAGASAWLRANTTPGSMVFQTDWDDFPRLLFYNDANTYVVGLDPTYLQLADAQLFDQWVAITRGKVELPGQAIRDRFGARYVISDLKHEAFLKRAAADPSMREVYRDDNAVVLVVE